MLPFCIMSSTSTYKTYPDGEEDDDPKYQTDNHSIIDDF